MPPEERRLLDSEAKVGLLADGGVLAEELGEGGSSEFASHGVLGGQPGVVDSAGLIGTAGAAMEDAAIDFDRVLDGFDDIEQADLAGGTGEPLVADAAVVGSSLGILMASRLLASELPQAPRSSATAARPAGIPERSARFCMPHSRYVIHQGHFLFVIIGTNYCSG